jgi:hypothetical protein
LSTENPDAEAQFDIAVTGGTGAHSTAAETTTRYEVELE